MNESDQEEEKIQSKYRSILKTLRGADLLWHRTSHSAFRAILGSGSVEPNTGQFDVTYRQSNSCYGRSIGAVCLFDFDTETLEAVISQSDSWAQFLVDRGVATLLIGINRTKLDRSKLSFAKDVQEYRKTFTPIVETWYRGNIATSTFNRLVLVKGSSAFDHEVLPFDAAAPEKVDSIAAVWVAEEERNRVARVEPTLAELVERSMR